MLNEDSSRSLQNAVNQKLNEGYALHGDPIVVSTTNVGIMFCQAVVHPNKEPFEKDNLLGSELPNLRHLHFN